MPLKLQALCSFHGSPLSVGLDLWFTFEPPWQPSMLPASRAYFDTVNNVLSSSVVPDATGGSNTASTVCEGVCIVPSTRGTRYGVLCSKAVHVA